MERSPLFSSDQLKSIGLSLVCCVGLVFVLGFINMRTEKRPVEQGHILQINQERGLPGPDVQETAPEKQNSHTVPQEPYVSGKTNSSEINSGKFLTAGESSQPFHPLAEPASEHLTAEPAGVNEAPKAGPKESTEPIDLSGGVVLKNRHLTAPALLNGTQQEEGIVAVEITVDADGNVTGARAVSKGSTITDRKLWAKAQQAATEAKFDKTTATGDEQHGIYYFKFSFL